MPNEIKINDTHLILLKRNSHDESVSIDYLPIINPMGDLLDGVYKNVKIRLLIKIMQKRFLTQMQVTEYVFNRI